MENFNSRETHVLSIIFVMDDLCKQRLMNQDLWGHSEKIIAIINFIKKNIGKNKIKNSHALLT